MQEKNLEIVSFLNEHKLLSSLSLWLFPHLAPQYFVLRDALGNIHCIRCEMIERGERLETGVLRLEHGLHSRPNSCEEVFLAGESEVSSCSAIAAVNEVESIGVRIKCNTGEFTIVPGAMPYSICVFRNFEQWGTPEFPISDYVRIQS
jgi:hypothetical protein